MTTKNISTQQFNDATSQEMRWGGEGDYIDCWEFVDGIGRAATGYNGIHFCKYERMPLNATVQAMLEPSAQDAVIEILERNLNTDFLNAIKNGNDKLTPDLIEQYLDKHIQDLQADDPSIAYMDDNLYFFKNGTISSSEIHMLYHVMTHLHQGDFLSVPDGPDGKDNSLKTHVAVDEFSAIWDPRFGEERKIEEAAKLPQNEATPNNELNQDLPTADTLPDVSANLQIQPIPTKKFIREIDYFSPTQQNRKLQYTLEGDNISLFYDLGDMPENERPNVQFIYEGTEVIDNRCVSTITGYGQLSPFQEADQYRDVLEISWNPDLTDSDDPEVEIRTWYGNNTPDAKAAQSANASGQFADLDGDGQFDPTVEQTSEFAFVNKSAAHPDGIDETQKMTDKNGKPITHGRVGVIHTNIGEKVDD